MKAVVTKPFPGVRDGEVHPVHHAEGDIVEGDLAKVAIDNGWAVDENDDGAASAGADGREKSPEDGPIVIPDNWVKEKWFAVRALAARIAGKAATDVAGVDEARAIIQAEVERRANAPAEGDGETDAEGNANGDGAGKSDQAE
jgi:hypothetical protein